MRCGVGVSSVTSRILPAVIQMLESMSVLHSESLIETEGSPIAQVSKKSAVVTERGHATPTFGC